MMVSTLYVGGCNFRCPYCFNVELVKSPYHLAIIPEEDIFSFLKQRKSFLDGICLSGGEPTLCDDIIQFLNKVRKQNFKIKLDTNGSNPDKLTSIIQQGLVDYIAMDIKSSLNFTTYQQAIGVQNSEVVTNIKKSIELVRDSGIQYEFRTTVVPSFHDGNIIEEIAQGIKGSCHYVLQSFLPSENLLDSNLKNIEPFPTQVMEEYQRKASLYVRKCTLK